MFGGKHAQHSQEEAYWQITPLSIHEISLSRGNLDLVKRAWHSFLVLDLLPNISPLKISSVKWLCLSRITPISYMMCTVAVNQRLHVMSLLSEDWTWVLWGVSSSLHVPALLHTKAEICTREALQQDRNFGKCSVRRGGRHARVWCRAPFWLQL